MANINEYKFCLNAIRKNKKEFNVFDIVHFLNIYFDYISFYPFIFRDLNLYAKDLGIVNITKSFELSSDIFTAHYSLWRFI
ncbi:MAG: hypothetical protein ACRDD7_09080 [Peptostreptococcaceae bacterium]